MAIMDINYEAMLIDIKSRLCCHEFANILHRLAEDEIDLVEAGMEIERLLEKMPEVVRIEDLS